MNSNSCCQSSFNIVSNNSIGEYVCYCNHVTEDDIKKAIENGAKDVKDVIKMTGAMTDSDCKKNNPKGTCCYPDIVFVYNKYK